MHIEWLFSLQSNPMTNLKKEQFEKVYPLFTHLHNISLERSNFSEHALRHYFFYTLFHVLEILKAKITKKVSNAAIVFLNLAESQFKENRTIANYAQQMNMSVKKLNLTIKYSFGKRHFNLYTIYWLRRLND